MSKNVAQHIRVKTCQKLIVFDTMLTLRAFGCGGVTKRVKTCQKHACQNVSKDVKTCQKRVNNITLLYQYVSTRVKNVSCELSWLWCLGSLGGLTGGPRKTHRMGLTGCCFGMRSDGIKVGDDTHPETLYVIYVVLYKTTRDPQERYLMG